MSFLRSAADGREVVLLSKVNMVAARLEKLDWITLGVIISKSETKRSKNASRSLLHLSAINRLTSNLCTYEGESFTHVTLVKASHLPLLPL